MRFLADENFPGSAVAILRNKGRDVAWVHKACPGMKDMDVLAWAEREARILLTFDKDFGELAWRLFSEGDGAPSCGVVLFRLPMPAAGSIGSMLARKILERADWTGKFSVIEPSRVRMRALGGANWKS